LPKLNEEKIQERLDLVGDLLKKGDFAMAKFLLEDLIYELKKVSVCLACWEKRKKEEEACL